MIIFNDWYGRLGNNIYQIYNVISLALINKHNICFKIRHCLFDLKVIEDYFRKYDNKQIVTDKDNFFYTEIPNNFNQSKLANDIMKSAFLIKNVNKLDKNDVVIHIRSGDIFSSSPHPLYIPPPLSYYIKWLSKYDYKKIIIISEDKLNPVVNKLLELYKNAVYNKNNLNDDIKLILGATNVICSIGTFPHSLIKLSNNIKNKYSVSTGELDEYYLVMKPWRNTKKQRDYILSYTYD